jgi:hypothetical protein
VHRGTDRVPESVLQSHRRFSCIFEFVSFDLLKSMSLSCRGGRLWVSGQRRARWATRSVVHGKRAGSSAARTVHLSTALSCEVFRGRCAKPVILLNLEFVPQQSVNASARLVQSRVARTVTNS